MKIPNVDDLIHKMVPLNAPHPYVSPYTHQVVEYRGPGNNFYRKAVFTVLNDRYNTDYVLSEKSDTKPINDDVVDSLKKQNEKHLNSFLRHT